MYSRSYNKNAPFSVPRQYGGTAFTRPRAGEGMKSQIPVSRPPVVYSQEAGERLYSPGDLPKINVPLPIAHDDEPWAEEVEEKTEEKAEERALEVPSPKRPSFLSAVGALGDDTLMLLALILLLSGCEDAGDTVILLILLLVLG